MAHGNTPLKTEDISLKVVIRDLSKKNHRKAIRSQYSHEVVLNDTVLIRAVYFPVRTSMGPKLPSD